MLAFLLSLFVGVTAPHTYSGKDLFSEKLIGAHSGDILKSFPECEIQQEEAPGGTLLCQTVAFGERIGVSFIFNQAKDVEIVSGIVAVENELTTAITFLRQALASLAASFPGQQEKQTPVGKEWFFVSKSGAMGLVELKKTNVKQWAVTFMISTKPDDKNTYEQRSTE